MKKAILLLSCLNLLPGCIPVEQRYQVAQAPGVRYLSGSCDFFAPRSWSYFPLNGIFVSLNLFERRFGLHYPKTTLAQLDSNELTVAGFLSGAPVTLRAKLVLARHEGLSSDPIEFEDMIDSISLRSNRAKQRNSDTFWASYSIRSPDVPPHSFSIPQDLEQASIRVPGMTINGTKFEARQFQLLHANHFWLAAVNGC